MWGVSENDVSAFPQIEKARWSLSLDEVKKAKILQTVFFSMTSQALINYQPPSL